MSRGLFLVQLLVLCGVLFAGKALGSAISGPSSSTTGSFSLTWPAGYELRLQDSSWRFAAPNTTSHAFVDLPSGT